VQKSSKVYIDVTSKQTAICPSPCQLAELPSSFDRQRHQFFPPIGSGAAKQTFLRFSTNKCHGLLPPMNVKQTFRNTFLKVWLYLYIFIWYRFHRRYDFCLPSAEFNFNFQLSVEQPKPFSLTTNCFLISQDFNKKLKNPNWIWGTAKEMLNPN